MRVKAWKQKGETWWKEGKKCEHNNRLITQRTCLVIYVLVLMEDFCIWLQLLSVICRGFIGSFKLCVGTKLELGWIKYLYFYLFSFNRGSVSVTEQTESDISYCLENFQTYPMKFWAYLKKLCITLHNSILLQKCSKYDQFLLYTFAM